MRESRADAIARPDRPGVPAGARQATRPGLRRASFYLMFGNGAALALAVTVQLATARAFGTSRALDAYVVGISVFAFLADWFLKDSANMVLIPLLQQAWTGPRGADPDPFRAYRTMAGLYLVFTVAALSACEALAGPIIGLLAPGLDTETRTLAVRLLRVSALVLLPSLASSVARAGLNAAGRFLLPAWATALQSAMSAACVLGLAPSIGIWALPAGLLAGAAASAALQVPALSRVGVPLTPALGAIPPQMGILAAFTVIGLAAYARVLADRYFASFLPSGSLAILAYAEKFRFPAMALFALSVSIPAFTAFSVASIARDRESLVRDVRYGMRMIAVATIPFVSLLVCLRLPLTRLWLEHGSFGSADTRHVASVFLALSPAFVVNAFSTLLVAALFAMGAQWVVARVVCAEIALGILLAWALVGPLGVVGLGLATSIATSLANALLWVRLSRRLGGIRSRDERSFFGRIAVATALACATATAVAGLTGDSAAAVPIAGVLGSIVYLVAATFLGVDEVRMLAARFRAVLQSTRS